jgi:hypothetical protein
MGPYLATQHGQELLEATSAESKTMEPIAVQWDPVTIRVVDEDLPFERCELADGWWAAVGRVPGSILTLDSRGVPLDTVRLEEIDDHPVPELPDLGSDTAAIREGLDARFAQVPFQRVHNLADYWALHAVEVDHVQRLGGDHSLSDTALHNLECHWLARLDSELAPVLGRLRHQSSDIMLNSRIARRLRGRNVLFQIWSNTIGPGARCWIGNRYTPIRRRTFRLRWRP